MLGYIVIKISNLKCIGEKFVTREWQENEMQKLEQYIYYKYKKQSISINYCEHKEQILKLGQVFT